MLPLKLTKKDDNSYVAEGDLTFFSINKNTLPSFEFLKSKSKISIDLTQINKVDSAGLALLIEWKKYSKLNHTELSLINIPKKLGILARLGGFEFGYC